MHITGKHISETIQNLYLHLQTQKTKLYVLDSNFLKQNGHTVDLGQTFFRLKTSYILTSFFSIALQQFTK